MKPTVATLNFTHRKRIEREAVRIVGRTDGLQDYFELEKLDVRDLDLDPTALIVIECFTGKVGFHRFVHGPLSDLEVLRSKRHEFSLFDLQNALFRLKIVSTHFESKGRILADADGIPMIFGGKPPALLPIEVSDLGDLVWSVDIPEDSGPSLQINERVLDPQQVARDDEFRAVVMPKVVERIALWLAESIEDGELDQFAKKWKKAFAILDVNFDLADTGTVEARRDLAEMTSRAFSKHHKLMEKFNIAQERRH